LDSRETLDAGSPEKWIHVKQIMPDEASGGTTNSNRVSDARARSGSARTRSSPDGRTDSRETFRAENPSPPEIPDQMLRHRRAFLNRPPDIHYPEPEDSRETLHAEMRAHFPIQKRPKM
jgi:hypothetical protein